ncbi:MAG: hypothetical protein F7B59_03150 [Desulfurococcales archaeon]|nr:hypothetical protein [Desulfurococcales archaeon]
MTILTTEEKVRLGILNGEVMGKSLRDYNRIAVLSQMGDQCLATSSSLISTFESLAGGIARFFPLSHEELKKTVDGVLAFEPQATVVIVGGMERMEECEIFLKNVLEEFAKRTFKSDIVICLRGYLSGCLSDITKADVSVLSYIELLKYLRLWSVMGYDANLGEMTFLFGRLSVSDGKVSIERVAEFPLTAEHFLLLRKLVEG